jgi:hypothetical protein
MNKSNNNNNGTKVGIENKQKMNVDEMCESSLEKLDKDCKYISNVIETGKQENLLQRKSISIIELMRFE